MTLGNSSGELLATEIDALLKSPGLDGTLSPWKDVQLQYGRKELERNVTWPRVCWVPIGGPIEVPGYTGGRTRAVDKDAQQLRSAGLRHDIFIHHSSYETAEALWKAMVASIHICASGSLAFEDFEIITETQAHDFTVDGVMYRQRVAISIPIHDTDRGTTEVLYQQHIGRFRGRTGDIDVCT